MAGRWSETELWRKLKENEDSDCDAVCSALEPFLKTVASVLNEGGTAPQSFTLHDGGHSFRVAERMCDVIPKEVFDALSHYEHALLLLSAYLHDVGMTPEAGRFISHREFLLGANDGDLSEGESKAFIAWLDADGVEYPAGLTAHAAELIVGRYVRTRHIDWGEEWTLAQTDGMKLGGYGTWKNDLCMLCRSHGEGYSYLASAEFEPRTVDSAGTVVHLRYLALALRVADVLEFDPERTPEAVYRHRAVDPSSKIFWHKDHGISLDIEDAEQVLITARPSSALIHKAIEETANDVDRELGLCRQVADTDPLDFRPGSKSRLPHRWNLPARAWRDVQPAAGSYEYIDGAFRPNTDRVLELVAGTALYNESFAAVRELVANGFDAVRAASALERTQRGGGDEGAGRSHWLKLGMELDDGAWWLTCSDTGLGMDKQAIERHFLVAGSPPRSRLLDIARRSREGGFELERSGEFGIGVLSYFMLADKIAMTTRELEGDEDGWDFEVEGLEGFGELRTSLDAPVGTTVRLRLREDLFEEPRAWAEELLQYLRQTVIRSPCAFEVDLEPLEEGSWQVDSGWVSEPSEFANYVVSALIYERSDDTRLELMGEQSRLEVEEHSAVAAEVVEDVTERLRWHVEEGRLADGLGAFRVSVPYWELEGGPCRVYMRAGSAGDEQDLRGFDHLPFPGHAYAGPTSLRTAWHGMQSDVESNVPYDMQRLALGIVEIDFDSSLAGDIQLRRDQAMLSESARLALRAFEAEIHRISAELSSALTPSRYRSLNMVYGFGEGAADEGEWRWLAPLKAGGSAVWKKVSFPCVSDSPKDFDAQLPGRATIQRKKITLLPSLMDAADISSGLAWHGGAVSPDRVVWFERRDSARAEREAGLMPLWLKPPATFKEEAPFGAEYPPEWVMLCGAHWRKYGTVRTAGFRSPISARTVWNAGNRLVCLAHPEARSWAKERFDFRGSGEDDWLSWAKSLDPLQHRDELRDPAYAAAWLLKLISTEIPGMEGFWAGIAERSGDYLHDMWSLLDLAEESEIMFLATGESDIFMVPQMNSVSLTQWKSAHLKTRDDWSMLPMPSKEWQLSLRSIA